MNKHIRHGHGSVRPYVYGKLDLPDFVRDVFGAKELERHNYPKGGSHVEMEIGDSLVVLEAAESFAPTSGVTRNSIYVYVQDVDAAYQRALAAGATSIGAPENKPYQERAGSVKDSFGNIWYISTYRGAGDGKPVRNDFGCVRPFVYGRPDLLQFVKNVFAADELELNRVAGGFHIKYHIGDSVLVTVGMEPPYAEAMPSSI